jgi:DNA/RNA-binding domain of Phe-tRNA-synthetase-like protein
MKDGQAVEEPPEPGEVVWRDDRGVTCRRWNRRQGPNPTGYRRRRMWFILESLAPMPIEALHKAGAELGEGLRAMMPDARVQTSFLIARETGCD